MPHAISIKDCSHRYRLVPDAFAEALGTAPEEVVGKTDGELEKQSVAHHQWAGDSDQENLSGRGL